VAEGAYGPSNPGRSIWTFGAGVHTNFTLQAHLADPADDPAPSGIRVDWTFERNLDGTEDTPSDVYMYFEERYWYRQCGA
jgi:hypothetical protein